MLKFNKCILPSPSKSERLKGSLSLGTKTFIFQCGKKVWFFYSTFMRLEKWKNLKSLMSSPEEEWTRNEVLITEWSVFRLVQGKMWWIMRLIPVHVLSAPKGWPHSCTLKFPFASLTFLEGKGRSKVSTIKRIGHWQDNFIRHIALRTDHGAQSETGTSILQFNA